MRGKYLKGIAFQSEQVKKLPERKVVMHQATHLNGMFELGMVAPRRQRYADL